MIFPCHNRRKPEVSAIRQVLKCEQALAPEWQNAHDLYEVCLKFVLSDSRVHAAIVGMRWPEEVDRNVRLLEGFRPPFDFAQLPRMTAEIYKAEDSECQ
jgi:predicted aldo/keto reductase-like oxidoreductase